MKSNNQTKNNYPKPASRTQLKKVFSTLFFGIVIIIFLVILFLHFSEWSQIAKIIQGGIWYWIILALILEFAYFANQARIFSSLYDFYRFPSNFKIIINLYLASNFINLATPSAGFSGLLLFASYGRKLGVRRTNSLIINGLFYLLTYGIFAILLLAVLIYLFYHGQLHRYQLICAGILFAIIITALITMLLGVYSSKNLNRFFRYSTWIINFIPKLFRRTPFIPAEKMQSVKLEIYESLKYFFGNWQGIIKPAFFALLGHILQIALLYVLFLTFNFHVSASVLLIGYAIGVLFLLISFTPSGLGIVEPTMTLTFVSFGVPLAVSGLVVIVFRAITFWLPFFLGFFSLNYLKSLPDIDEPLQQLSKK